MVTALYCDQKCTPSPPFAMTQMDTANSHSHQVLHGHQLAQQQQVLQAQGCGNGQSLARHRRWWWLPTSCGISGDPTACIHAHGAPNKTTWAHLQQWDASMMENWLQPHVIPMTQEATDTTAAIHHCGLQLNTAWIVRFSSKDFPGTMTIAAALFNVRWNASLELDFLLLFLITPCAMR